MRLLIYQSTMPPKKGSSKIFCVKCKKKTGTSDIVNKTAKNGRAMKQGTCTTCGTKKTQFIKG